jgi:choline dehydrogenase-like flavoprotein
VGRTLMFHTNSGVRATLRDRVGGHRLGFGTSICWDLHDHSSFPETGNLLLFPADLQGPMPADIARSSGLWGAALKEHVRREYGSNIKIISEGEMMPNPDNRVTLSTNATDRFGDPIPHLSVRMGAFELATIERGLEVGRRLMERIGAREIWTDSGAFGGHYIGTTCMGTDPAHSVCDEFGRCHELDNLYIAGSGVFSTSSASHPTLTIAALALRTADHLARSL